MKHLKNLVGAAAVAFVASAGSAAAMEIDVFNDTDINTGYSSDLRGKVACSVSCKVLRYDTGAYSFGDPGEVFDGLDPDPGGMNPEEAATWVNTVVGEALGSSPGYTTQNAVDGKQDDGNAVTADALYVLFKIGNNPDYILIYNDYIANGSIGSQTFSFEKSIGSHALSHSIAFGGECIKTPANDFCGTGVPVTPVPLPASLSFLLGSLGLFGIARHLKTRRS